MAEISLAGIIVMVAGGISVFALLVSKISLLIRGKQKEDSIFSSYECGFKNGLMPSFRYISENSFAISLYLVLELSVSWLLVCFALDIIDNEWSGKLFIKILSIIILTSILIASKAIFNNKNV